MNCININRLFLHFIFALSLINCAYCGSFNDTLVEITPQNGDPFVVKVTGPVEKKFFDNSVQVIGVKVTNQPLPRLKKGTVQNLIRATTIEFDNTSTEVVDVKAFRNIPRLKTIFLTHNEIRVIPEGIFQDLPSLNKIRLSNNKITVIQDAAFANIPKLTLLYVSSNQVQIWNPNWFANSTTLQEIDFKYNLIRKIPSDAFPDLNKLRKIALDYNEISEIEPDAFRGINQLQYLGLTFNRLTTIDSNVFPEQMSIVALNIESNKLNFVSNEVLNKVSVQKIGLDGNPWKCPCLDRVLSRLHEDNGTALNLDRCRNVKIPVCVFSQVDSHTCLDIVDEKVTQVYLNEVRTAIEALGTSKFFRCFRFD